MINGVGSQVKPFGEEICRALFADTPLIFLVNKADISSDEERAILLQTLTQLGPKSCVGIFDTVSGDHEPLLNLIPSAPSAAATTSTSARRRALRRASRAAKQSHCSSSARTASSQ